MRRLGLMVVMSLSGCHSTVSLSVPEPRDLSAPAADDLSAAVEDMTIPPGADLTPTGDSSCTPLNIDCQGLCGPIFDPCTNKFTHCGACEDGGVCDLFTHTCGVPKSNCNALGAECGVVRNSCGTRITCPSPLPYCGAGEECNNQTNKCITCDPTVSCADYGYQCGTAWLGCGDISNTIECGSCDSTHVCNPFYNLCEPVCSPAPAATLCADALASRGVECGFISDGCGSRVRCPDCAAGFGCAAQGEQNKCQPLEKPVECVAANRECGDISSVCGGIVHCGDCTSPDVCNSNGICGPPCSPMTCGLPCGLISDGCGSQAKCGTCPPGDVCLPNNMCCKPKVPNDYLSMGQCGTGLDDGCGGKINACCASGACTTGGCGTGTPGAIGSCCVNTATCNGVCNPSPPVLNTCTGQPLDCSCQAMNGGSTGFYCSTATNGTCQAKHDCKFYTANGADGQTCSNGPSFDDGTGNLIPCGCGNKPHYCITGTAPNGMVVNGAARGICCTDTSMCPAVGMCPATVPNTCVNATTNPGDQRGCRGNCNNGGVCDTTNNTCYNCGSLTPPANGANLAPCSNGNATWTDPNGDPITLNCPCGAGLVCVVSGGGNKGTCCQNTAVCPAGSATHCMVTGIPNNTCTGAPLNCGITCSAGANPPQICSGPDGTCVDANTCTNIGVRQPLPMPPAAFPESQLRGGADGNPCNDKGTFYQKSGGGFISCACNGHPSSVCAGETNTSEGTCTCTAATCSTSGSCDQNGQDNGCGGTKSCACTPPATCFSKSCCTPKNQCASPPSGIPMGSCNYGDTCGGSVGKQCCPTVNAGTGQPIEPGAVTCVAHSGSNPAYGDCVCTPTHKCTDPGIMDGDLDGCGHILVCGN